VDIIEQYLWVNKSEYFKLSDNEKFKFRYGLVNRNPQAVYNNFLKRKGVNKDPTESKDELINSLIHSLKRGKPLVRTKLIYEYDKYICESVGLGSNKIYFSSLIYDEETNKYNTDILDQVKSIKDIELRGITNQIYQENFIKNGSLGKLTVTTLWGSLYRCLLDVGREWNNKNLGEISIVKFNTMSRYMGEVAAEITNGLKLKNDDDKIWVVNKNNGGAFYKRWFSNSHHTNGDYNYLYVFSNETLTSKISIENFDKDVDNYKHCDIQYIETTLSDLSNTMISKLEKHYEFIKKTRGDNVVDLADARQGIDAERVTEELMKIINKNLDD
jgi:hypothetical protein